MKIIPYKFLSDTKITCGLDRTYLFFGSPVSGKECDKVFLNSQFLIYVRWIVSVTERRQQSFPKIAIYVRWITNRMVGLSVSRK